MDKSIFETEVHLSPTKRYRTHAKESLVPVGCFSVKYCLSVGAGFLNAMEDYNNFFLLNFPSFTYRLLDDRLEKTERETLWTFFFLFVFLLFSPRNGLLQVISE